MSLKYIKLGKIIVDSGIVFIGDPFLQNLEELDFWNNIDESAVYENCNSSPIVKDGVVVDSGIGDGIYSVSAEVDEWGNFRSIEIEIRSTLPFQEPDRQVICSLIHVQSGLLYLGDPTYTIDPHCGGLRLFDMAQVSYGKIKDAVLYEDKFEESGEVNVVHATTGMCIPAGLGTGIYTVHLAVDSDGNVYSLYINFSSPALDLISGYLRDDYDE